MLYPNGNDNMSSGPQIVVGTCMYRTSAAPKAGYPNGSEGSVPPNHAGMFLRACSGCHLSLLNSTH